MGRQTTDRETLLEIAEQLDQCKMFQDFGQVWVRLFADTAMKYRGQLRAIAGRMEGEADNQIAQCREQHADLRELIGLLARRVDLLEARPIVGIGPDTPRVYDGPLIQKFNDLYAKGEATNENEPT